MSSHDTIRVYPIWSCAKDQSNVVTSKRGDIKNLTFELCSVPPNNFVTDTDLWDFRGPANSQKWEKVDTVPWSHAQKRVIVKEGIDLPPSRRIPDNVLSQIWERLSLLFVHPNTHICFAHDGDVHLGQVHSFDLGNKVVLNYKKPGENNTYAATVPIDAEHIFSPKLRRAWPLLDDGAPDTNAGRGLATITVGTGAGQISQELLDRMKARARELHERATFSISASLMGQNNPLIPPPAHVPATTNVADADRWLARGQQTNDAQGLSVGTRFLLDLHVDGVHKSGYPVWATITKDGRSCRIEGDQTDMQWPPATRASNGSTITFTILRIEQQTRTTDEWLHQRGKFNPELITTWDPLLDCDNGIVERRVIEHCTSRAQEVGVPLHLCVTGTAHHKAATALATFLAEMMRLDVDWKASEDDARRGFVLQQEWRRVMWSNARRIDGSTYNLTALRSPDDPLNSLSDDLSKLLIKQNDDHAKNTRIGDRSRWRSQRAITSARGRGRATSLDTCYECGALGHFGRDCPVRLSRHQPAFGGPPNAMPYSQQYTQGVPATAGPIIARPRQPPALCTVCQKPGHTADRCFANPASINFRGHIAPQGFPAGGPLHK